LSTLAYSCSSVGEEFKKSFITLTQGQLWLRPRCCRGRRQEARGHRDGHLCLRGTRSGRRRRRPRTRGRKLSRHREDQCAQRQRSPALEFPSGASQGQETAIGTFPAAAAQLPGDGLHPRLDGGAEDEAPVRRLRQALARRGGPAPEALPRRGRHQRARRTCQTGWVIVYIINACVKLCLIRRWRT
jgi:hypothetical protein